MTFEIPLPWDVLDIAIQECIYGYAPGFVDYSHEIKNPGYSIFKLSQEQLGPLGEAVLRKRSEKITELSWPNPPYPDMEFVTASDIIWKPNYIRSTHNGNVKLNSEQLKFKIEELYQKRCDHLERVLQACFNRLVQDVGLWLANEATPPLGILAYAGMDEASYKWIRNRTNTADADTDESKLVLSKTVTLGNTKKSHYWLRLKNYLSTQVLIWYWDYMQKPYKGLPQSPDYLLGHIGINTTKIDYWRGYIEAWEKDKGYGYLIFGISDIFNGTRIDFHYSDASTWLVNIIIQESEKITQPSQPEEPKPTQPAQQEKQPWNLIPDHLWDRTAIKLWWDGFTNNEIGKKVGVTPRVVTNRISELRRLYPDADIPTNEERRKRMIKDDMG